MIGSPQQETIGTLLSRTNKKTKQTDDILKFNQVLNYGRRTKTTIIVKFKNQKPSTEIREKTKGENQNFFENIEETQLINEESSISPENLSPNNFLDLNYRFSTPSPKLNDSELLLNDFFAYQLQEHEKITNFRQDLIEIEQDVPPEKLSEKEFPTEKVSIRVEKDVPLEQFKDTKPPILESSKKKADDDIVITSSPSKPSSPRSKKRSPNKSKKKEEEQETTAETVEILDDDEEVSFQSRIMTRSSKKRKLQAPLLRYPGNTSDSVNLIDSDLELLQPGNFLNDAIIEFYLKYIQSKIENKDRFYFFNTFFYPTLKSGSHEKVKSWTKNVDIFEKDFIFVPINRNLHWSLIVISFKKGFLEKDKCLIALDSMEGYHTHFFNTIRDYLSAEWKHKRGSEYHFDPKVIPGKSPAVPKQSNQSDCGVFLLNFVEEFCVQPESINLGKKWFTQKDITQKRKEIKMLIDKLIKSENCL